MILTYTSKILCLWVCFEVSIGDKIMRDLLCVVTTVIICIAPVENENRPLNKIEFIHFQLITKRITIIESCSVLCLIYFEKMLICKNNYGCNVFKCSRDNCWKRIEEQGKWFKKYLWGHV